ncbi:MAG: sulfide/dihydroorotate dehydrogenase-like FAD/NAD-binding protein, partial [Caproiciproducens sp.]|nr:sulfide/dihydroorotate dehydrogenase-like FAD/NAD-binding protein [Caproiciproducens sp.]
VSDHLILTTDDGSNGNKGFVTDALRQNIENGAGYDLVIAIGPLVMMRAVCNLTKEYNIKTLISMNPIMIDGTGMCGGCRLTVGGKTKFACVDGPDFDGHEVDFDEAIQRSRTYSDMEKEATREYNCRLMEGTENA